MLLDGEEPETATPRLSFFTTDALSGIDHYLVKIDGEEVANVPASAMPEKGEYTLAALKEGEHTVLVDAVDRAGNATTAEAKTFTIPAGAAPAEVQTTAPLVSPAFIDGLIRVITYGFIGLLALFLLVAAIFTLYMVGKYLHADLVAAMKRRQGSHPHVLKNLKELRRDIKKLSLRLEEIDEQVERQIDRLST
jgi:hypothetical protein